MATGYSEYNPYNKRMSLQKPAVVVPRVIVGILAILLPIIIFYSTLFRWNTDLPCGDDYDILGFLIQVRSLHGFGARILYLFTAQHNEYKIILGHAVFAVQYLLLGRVSFAALNVIGDLGILCLGFLLWKMFLPSQKDLGRRVALFIPVGWLLFQLSYAETLNAAEPAVQNLYFFVFSFAAFILLVEEGGLRFAGSLACLITAICASGNGFIAAAVGGLFLLKRRQFSRLVAWTTVTVGMMVCYAYRYDAQTSQSSKHNSIFAAMRDLNLAYVISFLGSIGEIFHVIPHVPVLAGSLLLGIAFCLFYLYAIIRGKLSQHAAVNLAILFIFLTGVGVAAIRSDLGIAQSVSSRYRIYSSLLLVFVWFLSAEGYLQSVPSQLRRSWLYVTGCLAAIVLSLLLDIQGTHFIVMRYQVTVEGMKAYEHPSGPDDTTGPMFVDGPHGITFSPQVNRSVRMVLQQSQSTGIYRPPQY